MIFIVVNSLILYELSIVCVDSFVRIYDRRMLGIKVLGNNISSFIFVINFFFLCYIGKFD